jgi:hypothetical protein
VPAVHPVTSGMAHRGGIRCRLVLLVAFAEGFRDQRGTRGGSGSNRRANQKCTASFIMLGHKLSPPFTGRSDGSAAHGAAAVSGGGDGQALSPTRRMRGLQPLRLFLLPTARKVVHTMRGPNDGTCTSSDQGSTFSTAAWCALPHQKCYRTISANDWDGVTESGRCRQWREESA